MCLLDLLGDKKMWQLLSLFLFMVLFVEGSSFFFFFFFFFSLHSTQSPLLLPFSSLFFFNRGIGKKVMVEAEKEAQRRGFKKFYLYTDDMAPFYATCDYMFVSPSFFSFFYFSPLFLHLLITPPTKFQSLITSFFSFPTNSECDPLPSVKNSRQDEAATLSSLFGGRGGTPAYVWMCKSG